jgi:hypothetical protein
MTAGRPAPTDIGGRTPFLGGYGRRIGLLLIVIGLLQGTAWGFRVWVLILLSEGDRWLIVHTIVTLVSLIAALLLLRIGIRARRQQPSRRDPAWIGASGVWIAGVGVHRFVAVLTHPMTDPNPRAHLHLSVLFMVLGAVLLGVAWFWKRCDPMSTWRDGTPA